MQLEVTVANDGGEAQLGYKTNFSPGKPLESKFINAASKQPVFRWLNASSQLPVTTAAWPFPSASQSALTDSAFWSMIRSRITAFQAPAAKAPRRRLTEDD